MQDYCLGRLGKGCVVLLFKEHFLYRNDAGLRSPVSVGILKRRGVRGQGGLKALWFGAVSPRPAKIKAMPNVWQLLKLTAGSVRETPTMVWSFPTPCYFF